MSSSSSYFDPIILSCSRGKPLEDFELKEMFIKIAIYLKDDHHHSLINTKNKHIEKEEEKSIQSLEQQVDEVKDLILRKTTGFGNIERKVEKIGETLRNDFDELQQQVSKALLEVKANVQTLVNDLHKKTEVTIFHEFKKEMEALFKSHKKELEYNDYQIKQLKEQNHKLFKKTNKMDEAIQEAKRTVDGVKLVISSAKENGNVGFWKEFSEQNCKKIEKIKEKELNQVRRMSEGETQILSQPFSKETIEIPYSRETWSKISFKCYQEVLFSTYHSISVSEPSFIIGRRKITQGFSISILFEHLNKTGASIGIIASADLAKLSSSTNIEEEELSIFEYHSSGDVYVGNRFVKKEGSGYLVGETVTMRVSFGGGCLEWRVGNEKKCVVKRDAIEGVERGWSVFIKLGGSGDGIVVI